jgi:hypothetical protein
MRVIAPDSIQDPWERGYWEGQMEAKGTCGGIPNKPPLPSNVFDQDKYYHEEGYKRGFWDGLQERAGNKKS